MKNTRLLLVKTQPWLLAALVAVLLTACSQKIGFQNSTIAPAARGNVKVDRDKNGNYAIELDVKMLAEPERLAQPKSVYMVWMDTEQNGLQSLGRLKTSDGLIGSTLKAELKTTSPYKPRRVYITAEDNAAAQTPGTYVVLTTDSF